MVLFSMVNGYVVLKEFLKVSGGIIMTQPMQHGIGGVIVLLIINNRLLNRYH